VEANSFFAQIAKAFSKLLELSDQVAKTEVETEEILFSVYKLN
jgi:hypothetical protein